MTSKEISEELVIAHRTVDTHVEHILTKLNFQIPDSDRRLVLHLGTTRFVDAQTSGIRLEERFERLLPPGGDLGCLLRAQCLLMHRLNSRWSRR